MQIFTPPPQMTFSFFFFNLPRYEVTPGWEVRNCRSIFQGWINGLCWWGLNIQFRPIWSKKFKLFGVTCIQRFKKSGQKDRNTVFSIVLTIIFLGRHIQLSGERIYSEIKKSITLKQKNCSKHFCQTIVCGQFKIRLLPLTIII